MIVFLLIFSLSFSLSSDFNFLISLFVCLCFVVAPGQLQDRTWFHDAASCHDPVTISTWTTSLKRRMTSGTSRRNSTR